MRNMNRQDDFYTRKAKRLLISLEKREMTIETIMAYLKVSYNSAQRVISKLRETHGVYTIMEGKSVSYELSGKPRHCPNCYAISGVVLDGVSKCRKCGKLHLDNELLSPFSMQPCGHPYSSVMGTTTKWCGDCADNARMEQHYNGTAI